MDRLDNESKKLLQAHYSDAITLDMLREEQARIAIERARAQQALDLHTSSAELMERQLSYWATFITHADRHYRAADDIVRRQLNQSVFEKIWLDEDEVVGSDLTPVYRRMLADDLESELAHDRARAKRNHHKGCDLYAVPDPAPTPPTDDLAAPQDLPRRDRRHTTVAPLNRYLRAERPRGRLDWERKNPGPSKDRGSNNYFLVVLGSLNLNAQFSLPAPTDRSPESVRSARRRRITQSVRDEVVRLYASGQTALEVAEHCGIGKTTVLKILKADGAAVRPQASLSAARVFEYRY